VLRRVGAVLVSLGVADLFFMGYSFSRGIAYISSINALALIAGGLLWTGSLPAARFVAHASLGLVGALLTGLLAVPVIVPGKLLLVALKTASAQALLAWGLSLALPVLAFWVYRQLTTKAVTQALHDPLAVRRSFVAGAVVAALASVVVFVLLRAAVPEGLVSEARRRLGPDYEYFVTRIDTHTSGEPKSVSALVLAYDSERIENIEVTCVTSGASTGCRSVLRGESRNDPSSQDAPFAGAASVLRAQPPAGSPLALGHERFHMNDFRGAIEQYDAAVAADSSSIAGYYWRAVAYEKIGQRDRALADLEVLIEREVNDIDVYVRAQFILIRTQEWDRIIGMWTKFIERNPGSGRAYYDRGATRHRKGDREGALRDAEEACRLGFKMGCDAVERARARP
jgi:hypothetical protein